MEGYRAHWLVGDTLTAVRSAHTEEDVKALVAAYPDRITVEGPFVPAELLEGAVSRIEALRRAIDRALGSSSLGLPTRDTLTQALIDDDRAGGR